jgi:hypothetical protein
MADIKDTENLRIEFLNMKLYKEKFSTILEKREKPTTDLSKHEYWQSTKSPKPLKIKFNFMLNFLFHYNLHYLEFAH